MNFSRILTYIFIASLLGSQVEAMDQAVPGGNTTETVIKKATEIAGNITNKLVEVGSNHPYATLTTSGILLGGTLVKTVYTRFISDQVFHQELKKAIDTKNLPVIQALKARATKLNRLDFVNECTMAIDKQANEQYLIKKKTPVIVQTPVIDQPKADVIKLLLEIKTQALNVQQITIAPTDIASLTVDQLNAITAYNTTRNKPRILQILKSINKDVMKRLNQLSSSITEIKAFVTAYDNLCKTLGV